MTLVVWPSDFGLPSVEPDSLHFLACVKFCAAPVSIVTDVRPWLSGKYPIVQTDGGETIASLDRFLEYMRRTDQDIVLDSHLAEEERAESLAFACYVKAHLLPAYLYLLWMDNGNFNTVTGRWYGRTLPLFYGSYYAQRRRSAAIGYLRSLYPEKMATQKQVEFAVTRKAVHCVNMLSAKLGQRKYFYGDKPSALDALVFGYVAPLLKLPLPNDRLQQHIRANTNLVRFVETIVSIYMPLTDEEMTRQRVDMDEWEMRRSRAQEESGASRREEERQRADADSRGGGGGGDDALSTRDALIFGLIAVAVSVAAAVHFGILQVEQTNYSDDEVAFEPIPVLLFEQSE